MAEATQLKSSIQVLEVENQISGVLAVIERATLNPEIDIEKMERLLALQERVLAKQAEMLFNQAMVRLQPLLPIIEHDAEIKHSGKLISTYVRYDTIHKKVSPLYLAEGFALSFTSKKNANGSVTYTGLLSHRDGHSRNAEMDLPPDVSGAKNPVQAVGSTISYAKRYLVGMLLNLVTSDEKDDDAAALNKDNMTQGSGFKARAEAGNAAPTVEGTAERIEEAWDSQINTLNNTRILMKSVDKLSEGLATIKAMMGNTAGKKERTELINANLGFIRALAGAKRMDEINALHKLAGEGK